MDQLAQAMAQLLQQQQQQHEQAILQMQKQMNQRDNENLCLYWLFYPLTFPFPEEEPERRTEFYPKIFRKISRQLIMRQETRSKKFTDMYRYPNPVFLKGDLVVVYNKRGALVLKTTPKTPATGDRTMVHPTWFPHGKP